MPGFAMVFAPAPVLTVTIEQRAHAADVHLHAGGQGVWQARMLTALGHHVVLCGGFGGESGAVLRNLLGAEGIKVRAVHGSFHNGVYIQDRRSGRRETLAEAPAASPSRHDLDELHNLALAKGLKADISVLSGPAPCDGAVAPPDLYHRLAADLTESGRKVVADLSGPRLAAVADGGAFLLKVSHEELRAEQLAPGGTVPELVAAMHTLAASGCEAVVVSRAAEPALAMFGSQLYEVHLGRMEVADPLGCGDSMTAGIVAGLMRGLDLAGALRLGAAAGAVNATRHGLGTGGRQAVERLAKTVELRTLTEQTGQQIRVNRQELAAWLTHN